MADWMWFACIILGLILAASCVVKWIDAKIKIEKIFAEELGNNDHQNDSENG